MCNSLRAEAPVTFQPSVNPSGRDCSYSARPPPVPPVGGSRPHTPYGTVQVLPSVTWVPGWPWEDSNLACFRLGRAVGCGLLRPAPETTEGDPTGSPSSRLLVVAWPSRRAPPVRSR